MEDRSVHSENNDHSNRKEPSRALDKKLENQYPLVETLYFDASCWVHAVSQLREGTPVDDHSRMTCVSRENPLVTLGENHL